MVDNTLEKVNQQSLKYLSPLNLQETCRLIVEEGIKLIQTDFGSIFIAQNEELKRVYASSSFFNKIKHHKNDYIHKALKINKPVILSVKQIFRYHPEIKRIKIHSGIALPLTHKRKPVGVITMMSLKDNYFTGKRVRSLKLFIPLVMLAIRKAQLYDENSEAIETRDRFITMAAHELRTPLTTVNGYAQLLYSKLAKADTPESRWVEELSWESYRLTLLVNELMEINRVKTGQFHYTWKECCIREIVGRALKDFRFTHPQNKVVLKNKLKTGKSLIIGDYNKLLQVITNLLDNAVKFSPPDKAITIVLRRKPGYVISEIKDKGKGISRKDLPYIFDMFYKGENHTREGLGIGLFLAKNIITNHHGTICIKSNKNKGTTVEIKLPAPKI